MKLFYIDPQSYRNLSIYDYNLLSKMDNEIHYFCSKHYDYLTLPEGVICHKVFKYNKKKNKPLKALSYIGSYILIFFHLLNIRPDVIHVQWFRLESFDICMLRVMKIFLRTKIVYTAHNILPHNSGVKFLKKYRSIYHIVDHIIVHTKDTKQKLMDMFNIDSKKVSVIPHGLLKLNVNINEYERLLPSFKAKYNLDGKIVFASLGEQSPYKGVDVVADVWSSTPELYENPDVRLVLVGKQKQMKLDVLDGFENVIVENRRISNEEFYFLLKQTDVYILTYRLISQSGAMLTALTEHIPILVTDVGGLTDPINIAPVGWIIPELTVDEVKKAMLNILDNPVQINKIKSDEESWRKISHAYSWQQIACATLDLYSQISNKK